MQGNGEKVGEAQSESGITLRPERCKVKKREIDDPFNA